MYEIGKIKDYYKIDKPMLGDKKREIIQAKLQLQKNALRQTELRIKQDDYFVNYLDNPFIPKQNYLLNVGAAKINESKLIKNSSKGQGRMGLNIVQGLDEIKKKTFPYVFDEFKQNRLNY